MEIPNSTCEGRQPRSELHSDNEQENLSAETTITSINKKGDVSECDKVKRQEIGLDELPEVVFDYIYSILPMQDAARAACTSPEFLRSWRRFPKLVLNVHTLGLVDKKTGFFVKPVASTQFELKYPFTSITDRIFKNHSGIGMKELILDQPPFENIDASYLDKWIQIAVKAGIEELSLGMTTGGNNRSPKYNFPCSLLSDDIGETTVQSLRLTLCAFHPTSVFEFNKSLKSLYLYFVQTTGEELAHFVSNCHALVSLSICTCDITCFKVPCPLKQLNHFEVKNCKRLQVIDINAPKLSSFVNGNGRHQQISISLGAVVKNITMVGYYNQPNILRNSGTELLSFMPAVERLTLVSRRETANVPMLPSKFLHLKYLDIMLLGAFVFNYDFFSLISFLSASPTLETFILRIDYVIHPGESVRPEDSVLNDLCGDQLHLRQMPGCQPHDNLKNVTIARFLPLKSLVELTSHIVQNAPALSCMTLDTTSGCRGGRTATTNQCRPMNAEKLTMAHRGAEAAKSFIEEIVASAVSFRVLSPCDKCAV